MANFKTDENIPQVGRSLNDKSHTFQKVRLEDSGGGKDSHYSKVNDRLEEFVKYFTKEFEAKLSTYHLILEGEVKKAGAFSDTFSGTIGQGVGGGIGGLVGLLLGSSAMGARVGITAGQAGGEKIGSMVGNKKHKKNVAKLIDLIDLSQKDKPNFRRVLVEAGFDVFQSFEMQFMRVTTDDGPKKAMQQLAKDASNRAINYYTRQKDALIIEGVILGKSKIEPVLGVPIATSKIKTPGFEINYKYESSEEKWYTASLYEKVGLVIEGKTPGEITRYYEKKDGKSRTDKYGYRRLFTSESWNKLQDKYRFSSVEKSMQFIDYQYILSSKDSEQKPKDVLEKINLDDKGLTEERITKIVEETKDDIIAEINLFKKQSHRYIDDRKILENIKDNLKNLKVNEYLEKFKQYFEEAKQERQNIANCIEASREESREYFNQLNQKENIHHDDNKGEHRKTQEGIERVEEGIEGISRKINEIREAVVAQKNEQIKELIWFDVKEPVTLFTGREKELSELDTALQRNEGKDRVTVISQMTSISGLGGIGKTELVRTYAYDHHNDYDGNVIWINAENYGTLENSFLNLARDDRLGIHTKDNDGTEKTVEAIVTEIYRLFAKRKSLFIFDNAENNADLKKFLPLDLPPDANKPHILITSRDREWEAGIKVIELEELKLEDAIEFVKKRLGINDKSQDKEIETLVEKLQCFPLAIQQAVAYIEDQRVTRELSIGDYLEEYEKKTKDLLKSDVFKGIDNDYTKTTYTTWQITIDEMGNTEKYGQLALKILNVIAYLASEKISRNLFLELAGGNEEQLSSAVRLLVKYSIVNGEQKQSVLSIHRLVQQVIRLELKEQDTEDVLRSALKLIKGSEDVTHIVSICRYASKYSKLIGDFYSSSVYGENKSTPLHLLADSGDDKVIEAILKDTNNHNIDCKDIYGRTSLYRAAENGHMKVVEMLVNSGASIKVDSASAPSWGATKWTVLHIAAYTGNEDVVKWLLEKGADMNVKDSMNDSLYIAINRGNEEVAKLLDKTGESTLSIAASLGKLELVEDILEDKSEEDRRRMTNPAQQGKRGPLHLAANNGHLDVVKLLVNNGADISSSAKDGFTPLHMAASEGHQDIVEFLVKEAMEKSNGKFDILKISDISGWTVLHSAAKSGCTEILKYLINKFSKGTQKSLLINAADTKDTTLLQTAAFHGKLDTVEFLTDKEANINAADIFGSTPLFAAAICNHYNVVEHLLKQEKIRILCDVETVLGILAITPLHAAAVYDNLDMVKLLVKRSGVNAGEKGSLTPLHVAAFFDSSKVIKYLVDNGASTDEEINFANIVYVLNFIKGDLKGGYGSQFVDYIITPLNSFSRIPLVGNLIFSQFTPRMISTVLRYNNQLVQRGVNGQPIYSLRSRVISKILSVVPSAEKQLKMMKDYVQSKRRGGPAPPIGENSIFYDITNTLTQSRNSF